MTKYLSTLYKIFFIGLLLQFFAFNIVTFSRGIDGSWTTMIWLWKEILITLLIFLTVFLILSKRKRKLIFANRYITSMKLLFATAVIVTIVLNYLIHQLPRGVYALAFKYDFLGFLIFFVWFHSSTFVEKDDKDSLIQRYGNVLKIVLLLALGRYLITFIKPWILKIFGYNNFIFEGSAWGQAPAVYYTHINQWLPRNSFLFERPTTWGFYLIAFFPLFYQLTLKDKLLKYTRARRLIYALNIVITFSRAARWAWIIQLWILAFFQRRNSKQTFDLRKFGLKIVLPVVLAIWTLSFVGYKQIFARQYSNTWHIAMLKQWIEMSIEKPLYGHGPATAWPWSHRNPDQEWFNPENQFLQIFIEYGILGFLPWFALFVLLCLLWVVPYLKNNRIHESSQSEMHSQNTHPEISNSLDLLFSMSLGLIWLAASGMILHSFVDRMVVYPFMLLFGIVFGIYCIQYWYMPYTKSENNKSAWSKDQKH